jgi:predicted dehydrogenase
MTLKVALVGMGGIGHTHANAYINNEKAELVAVCDLIKQKADDAAEKYSARAYYSLKELLAHEDADIIDITTSGYENGSWHFEPAMLALDDGRNVLCEKPLSNDIEECREMVRFAASKNLRLGCNLNHYFSKTTAIADSLIAEGQVGELIHCLFKTGFDGGAYTYGGKGSARFNQPYGHMKAFLTHPFSVMRHFCGDVTHVQAFIDKPGYRRSASDLLLSINSVHVRFANGSIGYLLSHRGDAAFGLGGWWSYELAGSRGTFCIENCVEKITYWGAPTKEGKPEPVVTNTGISDFGQTFPDRIDAFLEDVAGNVPPQYVRASGRDALATMEYIFAAIESYENGGALVRPHALPAVHGDPIHEPL